MSHVACTASGRFGDIAWCLATAKELAKLSHARVDFWIMPQYESILPLLRGQSYIDKASMILTWRYEGEPYMTQPWRPQTWAEENSYARVYHLTFRRHPVIPLIDAVAEQQGLRFGQLVAPWVDTGEEMSSEPRSENFVAVGFNPHYRDEKAAFTEWLNSEMERQLQEVVEFVNVLNYPFREAAKKIRRARFFVGCRSVNYVLAHGVGQKCLVYEPDPARRPTLYGNPHGEEVMPELTDRQGFVETALNWWRRP